MSTNMLVQITVGSKVYGGPVKSRNNVSNDPQDPTWYVEFTHDEKSAGPTGQPGYWKQGIDPGHVQFVETK
jgi:hypothetical protein